MREIEGLGEFNLILSFLPEGWREKAIELGALRRRRGFDSVESLLRVLLIHLAEGKSLKETSVIAKLHAFADASAVAIFKRLKQAGPWLEWMNDQLARSWISRKKCLDFASDWKIRAVDATRIIGPGSKGPGWVLFYSIDMESLSCDEAKLFDSSEGGESLAKFSASPGDLIIGDRIYGTRRGIACANELGADVVVRFAISNLPLQTRTGDKFDALEAMKALSGGDVGDWPVQVSWNGATVKGRVCAIKKSPASAAKSLSKLRRVASKNGSATRPKTIEASKYFFVFTTVDSDKMSPDKVLELYRARWQIELAFKRMKSLMKIDELKKRDPLSAQAWINGKLLIALLLEAMSRCARDFSPWGWPGAAQSSEALVG